MGIDEIDAFLTHHAVRSPLDESMHLLPELLDTSGTE
jgi:hypothetical protein